MRSELQTKSGPADLTIIVADRHPFARAALAALLSYDGHRVFQAEDLRKSVSCLDQISNLGVLIVDLETPDWRLIVRHAVKATSALVIAMEGYHPFSEIYDLKERGIQIWLKKPITYSDLQSAIQQQFGISPRYENARDEVAAVGNRLA
jgi:DNA-binding NtrC family response regulator